MFKCALVVISDTCYHSSGHRLPSVLLDNATIVTMLLLSRELGILLFIIGYCFDIWMLQRYT